MDIKGSEQSRNKTTQGFHHSGTALNGSWPYLVDEETGKRMKLPREFYVRRAIKQEENSFFVKPDESNKQLIEYINQGFYFLLQGVCGSGKTTRCLYALNQQLSDYCCLYISLQAMEITDPKLFWFALAERLLIYNSNNINIKKITLSITTAKEFLNLFRNEALFTKKKVVLFVDGFDLLLNETEYIRTEFIEVLSEIKQHRDIYCLHSFVGICRPVEISESLFESVVAPTLTKEETENIFKEYCKEYSVQLPEELIEDIFSCTGGHPGYTALCGREIHETLLRGKNKLEMSEWMQFVKFLPDLIDSYFKDWM